MAGAFHNINYDPPPTVKNFIKSYTPGELFYDWIVGPVGSGKTTGIFFKLCYMASLQEPGPDGIRRTKAVVVRNTAPQLNDTTIASWFIWFKDGQAGKWYATQKNFLLKFGDVECLVMFRPLDTEQDIARVLSLEVTFVLVDEFVQVPRKVIDALSARVGRYPSSGADGVGPTNKGVWGASNTETEDNPWFDYLHNKCVRSPAPLPPDKNARYWVQPSGLSEEAENLKGLGNGDVERGRRYYTDIIKDKSEAWIKQYVEAEWGFSVSGKPVISSFRAAIHVKKARFSPNPALPLVAGFDPGIAGSAFVFGQQSLEGNLIIYGELVQSGLGARRLMTERFQPYLVRRFPNFPKGRVKITADPAAANRAQTDEKSVVEVVREYFPCEAETNNRLPLRVDGLDFFCSRLIDGEPGLLIDEENCPTLIRALKGGWRWTIDQKKDSIAGAEPEKNAFSHVGDAAGYLARYFHKIHQQESRYGAGAKFHPPRSFGPNYHAR
jgi:hypothetical protein